MNIVEPIYEAITTQNMPLLFETLGIKRYPINSKAEKLRWHEFSKKLGSARTQTVEKVLSAIIESGLVPIPPQVSSIYQAFLHKPDTPYQTATIADVFSISYSEFISAIEFLKPTALYSTEHGVKGEEYDNVIFVISRGWNNYQFDKYIPMLNSNVPDSSIAAFERNRNLFYVCCSRPRKRLVLFVTEIAATGNKSFEHRGTGQRPVYGLRAKFEVLTKGDHFVAVRGAGHKKAAPLGSSQAPNHAF